MRSFPFTLIVALLLTGCAETVDTRLRIDYPYSIYGLLNPRADTHGVRVFEIQSHIRLITPSPLDAEVHSTLLQTGAQQIWRDSVIQLEDGDFRHVYWASFRPKGGETYQLEVTRSDGATSTAITTVPGEITLEVLEPDTLTLGEAIMPILVSGSPPALPRIDVEYIVVGYAPGGSDPIYKSLTFNYGRDVLDVPGGNLIEVNLILDFLEIFREFDQDDALATDLIDLREINLRVHVGDANWVSPIGIFDPDFLVEPGSFSNVENGFGYFGSAYVDSITFRPPLVLLRRAGFYVGGAN